MSSSMLPSDFTPETSVVRSFIENQGPCESRPQLGELLVNAGLVSNDELESALSKQQDSDRRLGEVLTQLGMVEEDSLLPFIAQQIGIPYAKLREGLIDPNVVQLLPRGTAESVQAIAMFAVNGQLTVAMAEPQNLRHIDEIERITGLQARPVLVMRSSIERLLPRCYEKDFAVDAVTADVEADAVELHPDAFEVDIHEAKSQADGSPIINLVNYVIVHAVRQGASDIHIEPGKQHTTIRFRIDGQLREVLRPRHDFHPAIVSRVKVMAKLDIAEQRMPQDGRMHVVVERRPIDLRCSTLPTVIGEKVVLRVLDRQNVTFDLDKLGVPAQALAPIKSMLSRPYGLLLVTGPTGSGKTTTLYSAIELIKSVERNIVTVEDPVEYQLDLINQVQTGGSHSMTFANVLRSMLRQDPDVIMVGEIRDGETAEVSLQAALTGHLVLSTLHTNDSAGAITRLLDMNIPPFKIAAALGGVIAQRLIRKLCPKCKTTYYPPAEMLQMIGYKGDHRRQFVRGAGCAECFDSGFKGRVGIYEVMTTTQKLRELICEGAGLEELRSQAMKDGLQPLLSQGIALAEQGETSLEEVIRVAYFD